MLSIIEEWFLQGSVLQIVISIIAAVVGLVCYLILGKKGRIFLPFGTLFVAAFCTIIVSKQEFLAQILGVVVGGVSFSLFVGEALGSCVVPLLNYINRREVIVTGSLEEYNRYITALNAAHINYDTSMKGVGTNNRSKMGRFGENIQMETMYYIFAHKKDEGEAAFVIRKAKQETLR